MVNRRLARCDCGFLPPLCPTHHRPEQTSSGRFQINYRIVGQTLGDLVVIDRDLEHVRSAQPDCILECRVCKARRTLTMRYIRRAQQLQLEPRCYVCKPHVAAPRKRTKKKSLSYYQRRVRDMQQSQGAR